MDYDLKCSSTYFWQFLLREKVPLTEMQSFMLCTVRVENAGVETKRCPITRLEREYSRCAEHRRRGVETKRCPITRLEHNWQTCGGMERRS